MKTQDLEVLKTYLSEDEIKNLVIEEYRSIIREEIKSIHPEKRISNHDRIVGNSIYYFLEKECDEILGTNTKDLIEGHVKRILNKGEFSHSIFRGKNAWDNEEGVGATLLRQAVLSNKSLIEDKVRDQIDAIDIAQIKDTLMEVMIDLVNQKFKS